MRRIGSRRPSPAFVLAAIALFVALGGSAAALTGTNTVFSDDIVNGQIKAVDMKRGEVGTAGFQSVGLPAGPISSANYQKMTALTDQFGSGRLTVTSTRNVLIHATVAVETNGNGGDFVECKIQHKPVGGSFTDVPGGGPVAASLPSEFDTGQGFADATIPVDANDKVGPGRWDYRVVCRSITGKASGNVGTLQALVVR